MQELRRYVIEEYGDITTALNCIVRVVEKETTPAASNDRAISNHLIRMVSMIQKIERLKTRETIPDSKWEAIVLETQFLDRIVHMLNPELERDLYVIMRRQGLNTNRLKGPLVFKQIKLFCEDFSELISKTADRQEKAKAEAKRSSKSIHAVSSQPQESTLDEGGEVHSVYNNMRSGQSRGNWYNTKWRNPCPIQSHDHELGTCKAFMQMTPKEMRFRATNRLC